MSTVRTGRKSSFIWNFYDADSHEKARCRICKRIFSRKGCCTSGLITHLKKRHTEIFLLYLNKGLVCLDGLESSNIKKEPEENNAQTARLRSKRKLVPVNDEIKTLMEFENYACAPSSEHSVEIEEGQGKLEKSTTPTCLEDDEYPIVSIERNHRKTGARKDKEHPSSTLSQMATSQIETLLTKQLQIQAKVYKEMKEKLEQINAYLKESERINRKKFRLKVEKFRLQKEELKKKELHRKEMHRLRLLELEILNKKNIQGELHYDKL